MPKGETTKWAEPIVTKLPRAMQIAGCWCYLCGDAHDYDHPCYALRVYREEVVHDLEIADATDSGGSR